jgi:hypothetical protein
MTSTGNDGGTLTFRCPLSGQPFDTGFDPAGMCLAPQATTMRVRCKECGYWHTFRVADAVAAPPEAVPAQPSPSDEFTLSDAMAVIRARGK